MNKLNYIVSTLLLGWTVFMHAQSPVVVSERLLADTLSFGYRMSVPSRTSSYSVTGVNAAAFENAVNVDISKALYGKIAGLNVYQGSGSSADHISRLSLHGHAPLILIDGYPRTFSDITSFEIESCYILKDAAASALYGMRGANGVVLITTKRGTNDRLKVKIGYHFGIHTQFRPPQFADAYTYATSLNTALAGDGLSERYSARELDAFQTHIYPYEYPNVNWWNEALNHTGCTHNLKMSFNGGNEKFRYFTVIDYYRDHAMLKKNTEDKRYHTQPTDTRLLLRTNIDVNITETTFLQSGIVGKLQETNGTRYGRNAIFHPIYNTPSAVFPIRYENGIYGGNAVYGEKNPIALLKDYGHSRSMYGTLLADVTLRQELDALTRGLAAGVSVSFDNIGGMQENSGKEYRYMDANARI
ncbi:MAG: TonB-dependent receptor plug domain-containing protein, partial [Proteiniphilum sp.]